MTLKAGTMLENVLHLIGYSIVTLTKHMKYTPRVNVAILINLSNELSTWLMISFIMERVRLI